MDLIKALIVFGAEVEIHNDLGETPGLIAARTSKGQTETGLCVCVCVQKRWLSPTPSTAFTLSNTNSKAHGNKMAAENF